MKTNSYTIAGKTGKTHTFPSFPCFRTAGGGSGENGENLFKGFPVSPPFAAPPFWRCKMSARRGWIDVTQNGDAWDVYDWSEHHDSGALLGTFDDKQEAIVFAQAEAIKRNRKMYEGVLS